MIKSLIVDDEKPARERLIRKLAAFEDIQIVGEASDGLMALEKIELLRPDVVFLDIEMPELDGLGVAQALGNSETKIVFATAYDAYAIKAFETYAIDYLVKPVTEERLKLAVEKLRTVKKTGPELQALLRQFAEFQTPRPVAVRSGNRFVVVDPLRVTAILAKDHYAAVLVDGKELLLEESLDSTAEKFFNPNFLRVHRGAIINLNFLAELQNEGDRKYQAVLKDVNGTKVPISRERLPEVKKKLGLLND